MSASGNGSIEGAHFNFDGVWFDDQVHLQNGLRCKFSTYVVGRTFGHWKMILRVHAPTPIDVCLHIWGISINRNLFFTAKRANRWSPNYTLSHSTNTMSYDEIIEIAKNICRSFGVYAEKGNNCQDWVNRVLSGLNLPTHWTGFGGSVSSVAGVGSLAICNIV